MPSHKAFAIACTSRLPLLLPMHRGVPTHAVDGVVAGAFGWRLSADEVSALDRESSKLPSALGAPFENW